MAAPVLTRVWLAGFVVGACWRLSLYGLRRAEVCGLRWSDIDMAARTLTVSSTRVVVYAPGEGQVIDVKDPKSRRGARTLPLDDDLVTALKAMKARQAAERLAAGGAYQPAGLLAVNEIGQAVRPEWYSDEYHRLRQECRLPRITLHDARHTANSVMADAGVPDHIRPAWCGHAVAVNRDVYTHATDLSAARDALALAYGAQS